MVYLEIDIVDSDYDPCINPLVSHKFIPTLHCVGVGFVPLVHQSVHGTPHIAWSIHW